MNCTTHPAGLPATSFSSNEDVIVETIALNETLGKVFCPINANKFLLNSNKVQLFKFRFGTGLSTLLNLSYLFGRKKPNTKQSPDIRAY